MSKLVCYTRSPRHKFTMAHRLATMILEPKLPAPCVDHLMTQCFHRIYDCPCVPASLDLDRTERNNRRSERRRPTPAPFSGSVVSRQATGTLSCQSPMRILARWTSWASTFSQMGAGEPRLKTPAWILSNGGLLSTVGEELAYCMAEINQWQEPNSSQQLKPSDWPGEPRSKSSSGLTACL